MPSIRDHLKSWLHRVTVAQFSTQGAEIAMLNAARLAFQDSEYERSLSQALRAHLSRGSVNKAYLVAYTRWLDMLSRNGEAMPILEQALQSRNDPQLATQLAWAIADVAPIARFGENAKWIRMAETGATSAICIADTRGWMAFRVGDTATAKRYLAPLASSIENFPDIGYHLAAVAHAYGEYGEAAQYLKRCLAIDCPFGGIYEARRLQARLLQEVSSSATQSESMHVSINTIERFSTSHRGLTVSLSGNGVISLTWDRIWELADATDEHKQKCHLTEDGLGLVWPDQKLALTSLHLEEAAMKGSVPPQYRSMYGRYPQTWIENGVKVRLPSGQIMEFRL